MLITVLARAKYMQSYSIHNALQQLMLTNTATLKVSKTNINLCFFCYCQELLHEWWVASGKDSKGFSTYILH